MWKRDAEKDNMLETYSSIQLRHSGITLLGCRQGDKTKTS